MAIDDTPDLNLEIRRVAADPQPDGTLAVDIDTSRGPIPAVFHPHEGSDDLAPRGVSSLRLDYRRPGELAECVLDTLAGVSMLKGLGARRVALVGHSFGGAVVIAAGGLSPTVTAVAALSSQTYGATGAARLAPRPLLLVHGEDDTRLPAACSQQIYEWASEPKEIVLYPGAGHSLLECAAELRAMLAEWVVAQVSGLSP